MPATSSPDISIVLPNLRGGGVERVRLCLAREFLQRGYKVEFVLVKATGVWLSDASADFAIVDLDQPRLSAALLPLARHLRRTRPRSVLAAMWPLSSIVVWANALALSGSRVVLSEHTDLLANPEARSTFGRAAMAATMRASHPAAAGVVAVSAGAARSIGRLTGLGEDRIRIIHNPHHGVAAKPVEDPDFAHAWLAHPGSKLVAAGSFLPPKDFPTLLRAFAVLLKTRDARLLILGEGPLRGELEALAQALGIADKVFLPGFTLSPQDWIAQADLFVLSSRWEGFGNVIVEALAQGTPVVSTDCPSGPSEILCGGGLGILAPMGDPDALAAAIEAGLSKTWDRTMLKRRADDFTVPKAATEYLDLLLPNETSR